MRRTSRTNLKTYNLKNCFGFDENEVDFSEWNNSSSMNTASGPLEFQQNKPYRLALYVRPVEQKRLYRTNASILMTNTVEKQEKRKKNENRTSSRLPVKSESKKAAMKEKMKNVMLFDENVKPENVSKKVKTTPEKNITVTEVSSARKNVLREVNTKPVTKTKQKKIRKSYERKCKEKEMENIVEPPSEEIIKELDIKKLTRTKQKKTVKEEQEFEKWANNINSDFDDVDKFELSITYD